jgi:hypothetical protein
MQRGEPSQFPLVTASLRRRTLLDLLAPPEARLPAFCVFKLVASGLLQELIGGHRRKPAQALGIKDALGTDLRFTLVYVGGKQHEE